ncbi:MAG: MerR family transcriptional regulator [Actinomycetota bacterium]|nr:MerR family transcriptional regulator [Actinomycetota bacterium]
MVNKRSGIGRERPLYMISVAAGLSGMHPQTLRIYERRELIKPQRSAGNTRLYSEADIERLRLIQQLTQEEGINLAGVERIMALESEVERLRGEIDRMHARTEDVRRRAQRETEQVRREYRAEIVMVRRGGLARRD